MKEVCNISNKYWHPYKFAKHYCFYTRDLIAFSTTNIFWKMHLLPHLYYYQQWVNFALSNKYWLPNKSVKKCFYTRNLTLFLHFTKKDLSPLNKFPEKSTFCHIFTSFHIGWVFFKITFQTNTFAEQRTPLKNNSVLSMFLTQSSLVSLDFNEHKIVKMIRALNIKLMITMIFPLEW